MEPIIERYAPRFVVLSGVSVLIVLMAWLGIGLRLVERRQHPNPLSQTTEGYLRACQYQLVAWRSWSAATLREAAQLNRPVAVDMGAFWSGQCARLGQELYQDSGIADILKREFVPVKLDSDASPKRARTLRMVAEVLNLPYRQPLLVLFTPDGKPFAAATPETRAELTRLLEQVSLAYRNAPNEVQATAQRLEQALLARYVRAATPAPLTLQTAHALNAQLLDTLLKNEPADWSQPQPYWLNQTEWLLSLAEGGDPHARAMLLKRLRSLQQSPLWDGQRGGFHTLLEGLNAEGQPLGGKRLTENARLLSLYARASRFAPDLRLTADRLLDFLRHQLYQERPPGFRASVAPSRRASPVGQSLPVPEVDTTLYADGNALTVLALLDYSSVAPPDSEPSGWAQATAPRVLETLRGLRTVQGDLYHSSRRQVSDWLPDLALVARAASRLYQAQRSERALQFARQLLTLIETRYHDPTGGYYDISEGKRWASWTLIPTRVSEDGELPADNVLVALAQVEFARALQQRGLPGDDADARLYLQRARQTVQVMLGDRASIPERFTGCAIAISALQVF